MNNPCVETSKEDRCNLVKEGFAILQLQAHAEKNIHFMEQYVVSIQGGYDIQIQFFAVTGIFLRS